MKERSVEVSRTARYFTLGDSNTRTKDVWFVCHGYSQLAGVFLSYFASIADRHRLIVAPEGLSRFYVEGADEAGAEAVVGASWMTKEDRLSEINDYVSYLDLVYEKTFERMDRARVRVTVLGFSQGAATVSRWIDRGTARPDHIILWGGIVPEDIDLSKDAPIRRARLTLVVGSSDEYATPAVLAEAQEFLQQHDLDYKLVQFDGGHQVNKHVLQRLAMVGD